jgi:hypothetical protein
MIITNPFLFLQKNKIQNRRKYLKKLQPVVIMARGHSGTRVLAWICHHLKITMWTDQDRVSGDTDSNLNKKIKFIAKRNPFITETGTYQNYLRIIFEDAIYKYHKRIKNSDSLWGWKFPETYLLAPMVRDIFPNAKFIHMVRDGRDLAFKEHLTDDPGRKVGKKILAHLETLDKPHYLQAALSWQYQVEAFDNFAAENLNKNQLLTIKFEDLITSPQAVTKELCNFLEIELTEDCRLYIENEIIASKVKQHKNKPQQKLNEIEKYIKKTLARHEYL